MPLETGQVLDEKYRIERLIGTGGMGAVFEGENLRVRRKVAIKVLHPRTASNHESVLRFEREAQAAGRIGSDHILEVIDLGVLSSGERYMVMEYLDGEPLSARIARHGRLTPADLVPLVLQVLKGLGAAHDAGIVHRDLKPDNIFIVRQKANVRDFVKLIDFGISKIVDPPSDESAHLTRSGAVMGTPYYLSPEQANGSRDIDGRSDIYSLGVILYEAITGRVPFDARSFNELLFQIVLAEPPPPQTIVPEADPGFCSIAMKAMARDVDTRFQNCTEFARAIEDWSRTGRAVTIPPEFAEALAPHGRVSPDIAPARTNTRMGTGDARVASASAGQARQMNALLGQAQTGPSLVQSHDLERIRAHDAGAPMVGPSIPGGPSPRYSAHPELRILGSAQIPPNLPNTAGHWARADGAACRPVGSAGGSTLVTHIPGLQSNRRLLLFAGIGLGILGGVGLLISGLGTEMASSSLDRSTDDSVASVAPSSSSSSPSRSRASAADPSHAAEPAASVPSASTASPPHHDPWTAAANAAATGSTATPSELARKPDVARAAEDVRTEATARVPSSQDTARVTGFRPRTDGAPPKPTAPSSSDIDMGY